MTRKGECAARRSGAFAALAVLALAVGAGAVPRATRVQGRVEIRPPRAAAWAPVAVGTEIPEGSRLQTSIGARLEATLDDGSVLTLRENSIFEVVRVSSDPPRHHFRLWIGGLRNRVQPVERGGEYQVRTPIATAGVRGTDFALDVVEDGTTGLHVYDGSVWFRSDISDRQVTVGAGSASTALPSGDVSAPVASDAPPPEADDAFASSSASSAGPVSIAIEAPLDGEVVGAGSVAVVGTAVPGARLRVNGREVVCDMAGRFSTTVEVSDGANVIAVETEDGGGRTQVTVVVDASAPTVSIDVPNGHVTNRPVLNVAVTTVAGATVSAGGQTAAAPGGQATLTLSLAEGENLIPVEVVGPNGKRASTTLYVVLDTIPPLLTITATSNVTGGVRVAGVTEAGASVTANNYPLEVRGDGTFDDVLADLVSPVTIEARDRAGNLTRDLRSVTGAVDVSPPSLVSLAFSPSTAEAGASATATLQVADASAVQPTVTITLTGSNGGSLSGLLSASGTTYTGTIQVPASAASGAYAVDPFSLADVLGNAATLSPAASLTVQNNAPTASIAAVDAATGGNVTVSWSSNDADVASFTIYEDDVPVITAGASGTRTLTGRNNGPYSYTVKATDLAGNVSFPATVGVTITDADPPTVPSGLSVQGDPAPPQYKVTWSPSTDRSTAPNALVTYEVFVDGAGPFETPNTYFQISVTGGSKYVEVRAKDSEGNVSAKAGINVP